MRIKAIIMTDSRDIYAVVSDEGGYIDYRDLTKRQQRKARRISKNMTGIDTDFRSLINVNRTFKVDCSI